MSPRFVTSRQSAQLWSHFSE